MPLNKNVLNIDIKKNNHFVSINNNPINNNKNKYKKIIKTYETLNPNSGAAVPELCSFQTIPSASSVVFAVLSSSIITVLAVDRVNFLTTNDDENSNNATITDRDEEGGE